MKNKIWTVYAHINKINHKAYFGITKQSLSRRFRNGEGYNHCPVFLNAISKYGWDNFEHIVLVDNISQKEAIEWEKWLIKRYKTQDRQFGYNISPGGETVVDSELLSQLNKKRWKQGVYDNIKNKVYCVELQQEFESALQAERQLNIDNSSIQKACKGIHKYAGIKNGQALHWIFSNEKTPQKIKMLYNKEETLKGVSIPVYCKELHQQFSSAREAGEFLSIDQSSIRKNIKGTAKSAGKTSNGQPLHWISLKEKVNIGNFK